MLLTGGLVSKHRLALFGGLSIANPFLKSNNVTRGELLTTVRGENPGRLGNARFGSSFVISPYR